MLRVAHFRGEDKVLTCIQTTGLENFFRGDVSEERLAPIYVYLRNNNNYANKNRKDLHKRIASTIRYQNGSKERGT
jgi:hypothetical protein